MATSLTNLKLGQQQQHPGQPYGQPGAAATSATSTIIEYHGNYKELASNQENLSAAVLAQVSNSTKLREEEEEEDLWLGSPSLFIIVAYYDTFTEGHLLGQHVHLHIVFTAIRGTVRKRRGRRVLIELIIDYRQRGFQCHNYRVVMGELSMDTIVVLCYIVQLLLVAISSWPDAE